jgi:hypothetical protein
MVGGRGCYQPIITTKESNDPTFNIQQTYRFVSIFFTSFLSNCGKLHCSNPLILHFPWRKRRRHPRDLIRVIWDFLGLRLPPRGPLML